MHPLLGIITSTCTASLAPWEVGGAPTGSFFRLDRLGFLARRHGKGLLRGVCFGVWQRVAPKSDGLQPNRSNMHKAFYFPGIET